MTPPVSDVSSELPTRSAAVDCSPGCQLLGRLRGHGGFFLPLPSVHRRRSIYFQCSCFTLLGGSGNDCCGFINVWRHDAPWEVDFLGLRRSAAVGGSSGDGFPGSKKKVLRCNFLCSRVLFPKFQECMCECTHLSG
jgi:hypothetical protein